MTDFKYALNRSSIMRPVSLTSSVVSGWSSIPAAIFVMTEKPSSSIPQCAAVSASVTVDPAQSYQVEGRILEGRKYLLIPADDGAELNGVPVDIRKQ